MFFLEIVKGVEDPETSQIRIDVQVEIPGLYRETIPYVARVSDVRDPAEATRVMDEARAHAKAQAQAALDAWVLRRAQELQPPTQEAPRKRPGRPRKEAQPPPSHVAMELMVAEADSPLRTQEEITQGHPPLEAPLENSAESPKVDTERDPVPTPAGEPMDRKPEHEAILRELLVGAYGPAWMHRPDVKSAAMQMATHAIANQALCRDSAGQPHPQIRALFAEMVVAKCPA
jgi:hypothetical protein